MSQSRAPVEIFDEYGTAYTLEEMKKSSKITLLTYTSETNCRIALRPYMVECNFLRNKPTPKTPIITQGKYECAAASLAMVLGESLFSVKRAMAKQNWRNDDSGANDDIVIAAARSLGYDLIEYNIKHLSPTSSPCLITIKSLNVPKMNHALAWTGKELLDPNTNFPNRNYWGADWTVDMIEAGHCLKLLTFTLSQKERQEYDQYKKAQDEASLNAIKESIIQSLQK